MSLCMYIHSNNYTCLCFIIVTFVRATAMIFGLALMVVLLYFLLIVTVTVELKP